MAEVVCLYFADTSSYLPLVKIQLTAIPASQLKGVKPTVKSCVS